MIDILDDLASGIHIVFSTTTFSEMVHVLEENGGAPYHPQAMRPISPSLTFLTALCLSNHVYTVKYLFIRSYPGDTLF